ncbi:MAG: hypothetical protein AMXMBFR7_47330 [Planctomycetota bacterium]
MPRKPKPSRALTQDEVTHCLKWLARPRSLHGCWSVGQTLAAALGPRRAEYGKGTLNEYAKELGVSADVLRHMLRLGQKWKKGEVKAAQRAGLGFRAAQILVVLDTRGKSARRRRLVEKFRKKKLSRAGLYEKIRSAKAKPKRLKAGPRLRALLDLRRTLATRLDRVRARLQSDRRLWPAAQRPRVQRLSAQLRRIQEALEQRYQDAAKELRAR